MLDNFNFLACYDPLTFSDFLSGGFELAIAALFFPVIISLATKYFFLFVVEMQQEDFRPVIFMITHVVFFIPGLIMVTAASMFHFYFLQSKTYGYYIPAKSEALSFIFIIGLYITMSVLFSIIDVSVIRSLKCRLRTGGFWILLLGNAISLAPMSLLLCTEFIYPPPMY